MSRHQYKNMYTHKQGAHWCPKMGHTELFMSELKKLPKTEREAENERRVNRERLPPAESTFLSASNSFNRCHSHRFRSLTCTQQSPSCNTMSSRIWVTCCYRNNFRAGALGQHGCLWKVGGADSAAVHCITSYTIICVCVFVTRRWPSMKPLLATNKTSPKQKIINK